ncbi:MAG: hypothetical protein E5X76_17900 [Mesorhizobium sp.]|nr:MAG: hypothetical protein E5X76_17900 [Mesorhizobium sp.]
MTKDNNSIVTGRDLVLGEIAAILDTVVEQAQSGSIVDYAESAQEILELVEDRHFGVADDQTGELIFDEDCAEPASLDLDKLASGAPASASDFDQVARELSDALGGSMPAEILASAGIKLKADGTFEISSFNDPILRSATGSAQ